MTKHTLTDDTLFERWLDGDDAAFRLLYDRLAPIVLRIAMKHGLGVAEAKDAVQQTFLSVHRARADFRRGAHVRPWFFTIAYNVVRQYFRTKYARPEAALELDGVRDPVFEEPELERDPADIADCVRGAVARLPDGQRRVIELHWFDRRPFAEVATMVGSTEGAVRVRAHRGYEALRQILGRTDPCPSLALRA